MQHAKTAATMQDSAVPDDRLTAYMHQAVELSLAEVARGGVPFAALVIDPRDGVIGSGVNRVFAEQDPTAHAEIVALRDAKLLRGSAGIAGCTLIASGEPCGLCYVDSLDADISTIIYAVDRDESARYGIDYRSSYRLLASRPPERWNSVTVRAWPVEGCQEPFIVWSRGHDSGNHRT